MKYKNKIIIWVLAITFIPLFFSYSIFVNDKIKTKTKNIENNLLEAAEIIGNNKTIKNKLFEKKIDGTIEKKADEFVKILRDIDIIVVTDIDGIKYSHLDKKQIGEGFVNPVKWDLILNGEGYFSKMKGSVGITYRRFEPIYDINNENIIGFVMTGKYNYVINKMNQNTYSMFSLLFLTSLMICLILAVKFADEMRKKLYGLEPEEIGRLYIEEKLIIDNLESGLIAVNTKNEIVKINSVFNKKYSEKYLDDILLKMKKYLEDREDKVRYVEALIQGKRLHIKILPIYNLKEYFGTIFLIKTHNDVDTYVREVTGIDQLIEGMRANIHEFKNRLHVILGLINLGKIEMVKKYISEIQELNEYDFKKFKNIKNPFLKGMLLGKDSICRERKIDLEIDLESKIIEEKRTCFIEDVTTIVGNLIENAIEAFEQTKENDKKIKLKIIEISNRFEIEIKDNGVKIPEDILSKICQYGFSTKGNHRGVGLYLIKQKLSIYDGILEIEQEKDYKIFRIRMDKLDDESIGC